MELRVITGSEEFETLEESWKHLAAETDTTVYQTYEWNRIWWKHFGREGDLHLILIMDEGVLAGIAPFFRDTVRFAGKPVYNALRFLGSGVSHPGEKSFFGLEGISDSLDISCYMDILVKPGYEEPVARELANYVASVSHLYDEILLNEVPGESMILTLLVPLLRKNGTRVAVSDGASCVQILLDPSWNEYLNRQSKNSRKKARRNVKKVEDRQKKRFSFHGVAHEKEVPVAYKTLVEMHQKQWNRKGFPGLFYKKEVVQFLEEIARKFYKRGWLQIKTLSDADDESCVAADLFYTYKKRIYSIVGGMDEESELTSAGAGNVIFTMTLKEALENGCNVFDYVAGLQEYKLRRGDIVSTNKTILIRSSGQKAEKRMFFIKTYLRTQQKLRGEADQLRVLCKEKGYSKGIRAYCSLLIQRATSKRTATKQIS